MKECTIENIGRHLMCEEVKWFVYSFYIEGKMSAIDYLELIKKNSFIGFLKIKGLYKIVGARHTKKVLIHESLERFIILKINSKEYANSIINLTDIDINTSNSKYQRNENVYLELLSHIFDGICKLEFQYKIDHYRIDLYITEYKIAIEFDEASHFVDVNKIKHDEKRQMEIEAKLGCQFYRIDEREDVLSQIDKIAKSVIKQITGIEPIFNGRFITESSLDTILDIVKDFDLYFTLRNRVALGEDKSTITHYDKMKIESIEEKMAFAINMGYINSFDMLLTELRRLWNHKYKSIPTEIAS